jgi:hypothetical protein
MIDWWTEVDGAILDCLDQAGSMSLTDLACQVGLSEGEAAHFVSMLVREGKVRIRAVELNDPPQAEQTGSGSARDRTVRRPSDSGHGRTAEGVPHQGLHVSP